MSALGLWPLRVVWLALPLVSGVCIADAVEGRSSPVRLVVLGLVWAGWTAGLLATLLPRPVTLTVLRTLAPAGLAATGWATAAGGDPSIADVAALAATATATVLAMAPAVGDAFVDGASYGAERRMPLRAPAAVLLGPLELAWVVAVAGVVAGPLLLAAQQWVVGIAAVVVGWPAAGLAGRSLHQLALRWVVFVPTGVVLHDPIATPEPHLFLGRSVRRLGPAVDDPDLDRTEASRLDLTQGAAGLVLALELNEPHDVLVSAGRGDGRHVQTDAVLFTPSRPGAVLDEAGERGLPVALIAAATRFRPSGRRGHAVGGDHQLGPVAALPSLVMARFTWVFTVAGLR